MFLDAAFRSFRPASRLENRSFSMLEVDIGRKFVSSQCLVPDLDAWRLEVATMVESVDTQEFVGLDSST